MSFGHFVGSKHVVALRAIGRIESPMARLNVILEAFRSSDEAERAKYPTFEETLKEAMKATEVRNAIAHGAVRWIELNKGQRVHFLTPTLATTRKTVQIDRLDQKAMTGAKTEADVFKAQCDYALNAADIDAYRAEFGRLLEAVRSCKFPSAEFYIPA